MRRVFDCAESGQDSPLPPCPMLPSASSYGVGTPKGLIPQLNGWPACTPVNASTSASRPPPHDSGPGRLAGSSLYDSLIRNSLPVLTGALLGK